MKMASEDFQPQDSISQDLATTKTASSVRQPPELEVPGSSSSLCSQLGEAIWKPGSPLTPSPDGAAAITQILQRLELMEIESRELLSRLFSMVQTDARLQRYIHRRLQDHRLSSMWGLVEQILAAQQGTLDFETVLRSSDLGSGSYSPADDKEVKESEEGDVCNERFKVRQFDKDIAGGIDGQPPAQPSAAGASINPPPV